MTAPNQLSGYLSAFRAWALNPEGNDRSTWEIERRDARDLFEQLATTETERDDFEASQARLLEQLEAMQDGLREILALRENQGQIGLPTAWEIAERTLGPNPASSPAEGWNSDCG